MKPFAFFFSIVSLVVCLAGKSLKSRVSITKKSLHTHLLKQDPKSVQSQKASVGASFPGALEEPTNSSLPIIFTSVPADFEEFKVDKMDLELFKRLFKDKGVTAGESQDIFRTMNIGKSGKVNSQEWNDFYKNFIKPFVSCDGNKNWRLNETEFSLCLMEKEFASIRSIKSNFSSLAIIFERNLNDGFTFFHYMFLRKINSAWRHCGNVDRIAAGNIPCALHIISPGRIIEIGEARRIFDLGVLLTRAQNKIRGFLDIMSFIITANIYFYYNEFDKPIFSGQLSKGEILRGIEYQTLPTYITPDIVNDFFSYIDPQNENYDEITYEEFGVFLYFFKFFFRYSTKTNLKIFMTYQNFVSLLEDPLFDQVVLTVIKSFYTPDLEAKTHKEDNCSLLNQTKYNEDDYLVTFLQTKSNKKFRTLSSHKSQKSKTTTELRNELLLEVKKADEEKKKTNASNFEINLKVSYGTFGSCF